MAITFNDTTTKQGLVQHLQFLAGQNSTSLPIADATRLLNFALDDYTYIALTSDGRWKFDDSTNTDYPIATTDLTQGQNSYVLETSHLTIDEVLVKNEAGKWVKVQPVDRKTSDKPYESSDLPLETKYETNGLPTEYDYEAGTLFLYPAPSYTSTSGLKIHFSRALNYFETTDTTATVGIPSIHTEYLVLHAMARLGLRTNDQNTIAVRNELVAQEQRIRDFYSKRDEDTPFKFKGKMKIRE